MLAHAESLNTWSQAWINLVWAVLLQSTLLAVLVALVVRVLRRSSPPLRYWLWQIVAIKLLLMPFWTWAVSLPFVLGGETFRSSANTIRSEAAPVWPSPLIVPFADTGSTTVAEVQTPLTAWISILAAVSWRSWVFVAWFAIVLGQLVRLLWQRMRLRLVLKGAIGAEAAVLRLVCDLAMRLGLRRLPAVVLTDVGCSPFVCGMWRPVLVLERSLAASLDPGRLGQVLLHELAHVKRRDLVWSWLPEMARIVYFFHPIVHWVSYRIRLERELACDQLAMAASGVNAAAYAETLVQVVSHSSQPAVFRAAAASAVARGRDGPTGVAT